MASLPPPSFFSLILDKSATNLKISTEFVTKHLKNEIPKGPIIICADGGYSWKIEIKKIGEDYYFDSGWTNVVKDANFMFGDFVLFTLVDDNYKFEMFVYDKNSCERSLPKKVEVVEDDGSNSVDNIAANVDVVNDDDDVDNSEDDDDDDDVEDSEDDDDADVDDDDDDDDDDNDVDDGKEEEDEEEEDDDDDAGYIDGDDGDPFFMLTISKARRTNLRLPEEFVKLAGIEDERSILLKNLDGEELRMELRPEKVNQSDKLYISSGWADFQQNNDLREGDECVLKFIKSEGKILLAKVTKKKRPARQSQPSGECSKTEVVKRKRGRELHAHGRDVDVESEDEYMEMVKRLRGNDDDDEHEDSDEDEDEDEDGEDDNDDDDDGDEGEENDEEKDGVDIDGNPFFEFTITKSHRSILRLPEEFVGLPGIKGNGSIIVKNLKGEEWQIGVLLDKAFKSERYLLSAGWVRCIRSNDISVGDKCILKFIKKEGKFCLAKVTKKQRRAWQPQSSGEILAPEDVKRKRGPPPHEPGGDVDVESEDDCVELVKRPCGEDNNDEDYYIDNDNDINENDNHNDNDSEDEDDSDGGGGNDGDVDVKNEDERVEILKRPCGEDHDEQDDCKDDGQDNDNDGEDDKNGDVGDPTFSTIISKCNELRLPEAFSGLLGINAAGIIMLKNLTGEECPMGVRLNKKYQKSKRYILSAGWPGFLRSNGISVGDECVLKLIRNEGRLCLTKVTKKNSPTRQARPSSEIDVTEVVKTKSQPPRKDLGDMDVENEDQCVEVVKRPCVEGDGKEDDKDDDLEDDDDNNDNDGQDDIDAGGGNIDGDVGDLSFTTIIPKRMYLALPEEFAGVPGIKAGENIMMKNLKGEEWPVGVRLNTAYQKSVRYTLTVGCLEFLRDNNLSEGDECVFKFIRNEGKLCLAKVKNKRQLRTRKSADDDDDDDDDDVDDDDDDDDDDVYEGEEEEEDDDLDMDGDDPFFILTISKAHRTNLRLPDEFVELAGIEDERSIMLKNLDGEEWRMDLRPGKVNQSKKLYISSGWADFQQSNDLQEGDECVLKFIRSKGKILLAKVTKKKRPTRQLQASGESSKTKVVKKKKRGRELHAHGRDLDVESEDEYIEPVKKRFRGNDDDDKDDDSDEDEYGEGDSDYDGDGNEGEEDNVEEEDGVDIDGHPFFTSTLSISYRSKLWFPANFVRLARIEAARTITLKNLDGEESSMLLHRMEKDSQIRYYSSWGWPGFQRRNKLREGDKCLFKYITSEGKICLAKVTKKQRPTRQLQASGESSKTKVVKKKRGRELHAHGRDVDVESEDEYMEPVKKRLRGNDDDDKDEDSDEDEDEGDNDYDDDGNEGEEDNVEEEDGVDIDGHPFFTSTISISYRSKLWFPANFVRLARIEAARTITLKNLDGQEMSMRLLRMEKDGQVRYYSSWGSPGIQGRNKLREGDKCLFKYITSEGKICLTKVTKKQRPARQPQLSAEIVGTRYVKRTRGREDGGDMDVESDECMEVMKRPRHEDEDDDDGDPFFIVTIREAKYLRLSKEFVGLPGIHAGGTITLKNVKGKEWKIGVVCDKSYWKSERYLLQTGWLDFRRKNNDISAGDECIFKFIRKEGKFCLAKVTN